MRPTLFKPNLLVACLLTCLLTLAPSTVLADSAQNPDTKQHNKPIEFINASGLWTDVNSADFDQGYLIIAQDNQDIHMTHYVEYKGQPLVEYGKGTRVGNQLSYQVTVTRKIPGWVTKGTHILTLSADGQSLEGRYESKLGSGPLKFVRAVK